MKKMNQKGFTLAELLIVVAVIAVLVAIAIPTFADQLEKARQAVDLSNLRGAYSAAKIAAMDGKIGDTKITGASDEFFSYDPSSGALTKVEATSTVTPYGRGLATKAIADSSNLDAVAVYDNTHMPTKDSWILVSFRVADTVSPRMITFETGKTQTLTDYDATDDNGTPKSGVITNLVGAYEDETIAPNGNTGAAINLSKTDNKVIVTTAKGAFKATLAQLLTADSDAKVSVDGVDKATSGDIELHHADAGKTHTVVVKSKLGTATFNIEVPDKA